MSVSEQEPTNTNLPPVAVSVVEDTVVHNTPPAPTPTELSEEEISDLVDLVLCADDVNDFSLEAVSELYDFLHVAGTDDGLDFQVEGQTYFFTYKELAQKIDNLILVGVYPFSSSESLLDDYAHPR